MIKGIVKQNHIKASTKKYITSIITILFISIGLILLVKSNINNIAEKEEISANNDKLIKEEYKKVIKYLKKDAEETYALSDINHDGVKELIIISGISEADKTIYCFTYAEAKAVYCGSTWSTHSTYFEEENENFLIRLTYIQGIETLSHLLLENGKLKEEVVYNKDVSNSEQFEMSEKQKAIKFVDINDLSMIDEM